MKNKETLPCYQKCGQKVNIHFDLFLPKNMKGSFFLSFQLSSDREMLKTLSGNLELTGRLRAEEKLIKAKEAKCKQKQNVSYLDNCIQASISTD